MRYSSECKQIKAMPRSMFLSILYSCILLKVRATQGSCQGKFVRLFFILVMPVRMGEGGGGRLVTSNLNSSQGCTNGNAKIRKRTWRTFKSHCELNYSGDILNSRPRPHFRAELLGVVHIKEYSFILSCKI